MKKFLLFLSLAACINSYSQTRFENGYFLKNDGTKVVCLIKNIDWKNNPDQFEYKLTESSDVYKETIARVKKFAIANKHTFERFAIKIDTSSNIARSMDYSREPKFKNATVFLKVLTDGDAMLYSYNKSLLKRYFYSLDKEEAKQLIFKKYLIYNERNGQEEIAINNQYKRQLLLDIICEKITEDQIKRLKYEEKSLIKFFNEYNDCTNPIVAVSSDKKVHDQKKDLFNLSVRGGIKSGSLVRTTSYSEIDFGNNTNIHIGLEAEFIMPFNNGKWALLLEPTYTSYEAQADAPLDPFFSSIDVKYSALTFPIGIRHNFYLMDKSRIFINMGYKFYISDISFEDYIKFLPGPTQGNADLRNMAIVGAGFRIGKSSLEVRYGSNALFGDSISKKYNETSIIFGYTIL